MHRQGWAGIPIILAAVLSAASSAQGEMASYQDFRILDSPWVNNRDMALYLKGGADVYRDNSPKYALNTLESSSVRDDADGSGNFNPCFDLKDSTLNHDFTLHLPLNSYYSFSEQVEYNQNYDPTFPGTNDSLHEYLFASVSIDPNAQCFAYFGNWFLGTTTAVRLNKSKIHSRNEYRSISPSYSSWSENKTTTYAVNVSAGETVRIGLGRDFEGSYAYQAMQIVDDLNRGGRLLQTVSGDDMKVLSEIIAIERRRYYYDDREQTMAAVEKIARFLVDKGYLAAGDLRGMLIVDDVYRNITTGVRRFGQSADLLLGGGMDRRGGHTEREERCSYPWMQMLNKRGYDETYECTQWSAGVEYNAYHPLSQQWQADWGASVIAGQDRNRQEQVFDDSHSYRECEQSLSVAPALYATLRYFYSTRWRIYLTNGLEGQWAKQVEKEATIPDVGNDDRLEIHNDLFQVRNSFSLNSQYQVYYGLCLNLNVSLDYQYLCVSSADIRGNRYSASSSLALEETVNDLGPQHYFYWHAGVNISYRLF